MGKLFRLILVIAVLYLLSADALISAELAEFSGTWVVRFGDRNLFVLNLTTDGDSLRGSIERPNKFSATNSLISAVSGLVRRDTLVRSRFADGGLHVTFRNPNDAKDEDNYFLVLKGNGLEMVWDGLPPEVILEPFLFEHGAATSRVATDWEPNRAYSSSDSDVQNLEMKAIFEEDQKARQVQQIDWQVLEKIDAARREQTRKLLGSGALHTGKDYEEASFVFQHGDSPQDYLLAHTLAVVAVSKGDAGAVWIAAATLDRYLQRIEQKQIYGTQYLSDSKGIWTQDPYDRALISDSLRRQLGVPSHALQAKQLTLNQAHK